ncbi:hypothetical protein SFC42_24970 [Priestia filamentosa]|uniref:oligosaccharide flippase family protein n=1 Tax=Priestia filamentosa TaxID=1402861 RepID=UPI0039838858
MAKETNIIKRGLTNISYTFAAQIVNLLVSLIKVLWIPKLIGINEFSYWQLYVFYSSYVGFFQFGLNDGIYLRYGGKNYKDLDEKLFRSQFWLLTFSQFIIALVIMVYASSFSTDRGYILKVTSLSLVISGIASFFWFVLQGTNRIKEYALVLLVEKILFLISVLILSFYQVSSFTPFMIADVSSKIVSLVVCIILGRNLVFGRIAKLGQAIRESLSNMSVGIKLMIANISSMLILGVGRYVIDITWGVKVFGEFSLTLSVISMVLLFINAISVVLFPALRKVSLNELSKTYISLKTLLMIILLSILILYIPLKSFLNIWFPEYKTSIKYLCILLPLCVFDGKMQMLVATYLKVIRREGKLLIINIISVILSAGLCLFAALVLNKVILVIISMVIAVGIRCLIAELYLASQLKISLIRNIIFEILLIGLFMITAWFYDSWLSTFIYGILYFVYIYLIKNDMKTTFKLIKLSK